MSPSSAGMPVMTLPYEPIVRQTHRLTVNDDEWSVGGDVSGLRGTVIRGDGYPAAPTSSGLPPSFTDSSSTSSTSLRHSRNHRTTPRRETE
ncbi:hypothetical protein NECAME_11237, partial [Necator americanus]